MSNNLTQQDIKTFSEDIKLNDIPPLSRLTVVLQVYHETQDGPKLLPTTPFSRNLKTHEESYTRTIEIGQEWTPLNFGWVEDDPTYLVLSNLGGQRRQVQPTREQQVEDESKILEIAIEIDNPVKEKSEFSNALISALIYIPIAQLFPRESFPVSPLNPGKYRVRCRSGKTRMQLSAVPQ